MKAVIVELRGNRAAVLAKDGNFTIVPNRNYTVGQIIELQEKKQNMTFFHRAASVAALVAVCAGITSYALPYSRVSLDVNPSFTYSLNLYDRVLKMTALNGDAKETVSSLGGKVFGKTIAEAVSETLHALNSQGYFATESDADIILSVSGNAAHSEGLAKQLKVSAEAAASGFDVSSGQSAFRVYSAAVSDGLAKEAEKKGISAGKLYMIEQLKNTKSGDEAFDADVWINRSVKEITDAMEETAAPAAAPEEKAVPVQPEKPDAITRPPETAGYTVPAENSPAPQKTYMPEKPPEQSGGGDTRKTESKRSRQTAEKAAAESAAAEPQPTESAAPPAPSGESGQQNTGNPNPESQNTESRNSGHESRNEIGPGITNAASTASESAAAAGSPDNPSAESTGDTGTESSAAGTDQKSRTEVQGVAPGGNSPQPSPDQGRHSPGGPAQR